MKARLLRRMPEGVLARLVLERRYEGSWLRRDILAGLALTALLIPEGIAYAQLAGLPPITGLYATLVPLIVYALVGPSRILVLGPDSALAPLVAVAIVPIAGNDPSERVALAGLLALMVGVLLVAGAIARLGFLTDLLSKPVRIGFLSGLAVLVIVDQLPSLLGIAKTEGGFLHDINVLVTNLGSVDATAAAIGATGVVLIASSGRFTPRLPGILVVVAGAAVLVSAFDLGIPVMGNVPGGLPSPQIPSIPSDGLARLGAGALAMALLAFADTSVLSRSYASRLGQSVQPNHELAALGLANAAAGLVQGFPVSASASRTPVAEAAGARTQIAGLVAAAGIAFVLTAGTGLLSDIPQTVIAAVIITAVGRLIDIPALRWLYDVNKGDFVLSLAALFGVVAFGILPGIGIAVGLSVLAVLEHAWHPYTAVLARVTGLKGYHDTSRHPEGREVPGLVLFRFDAPLFFANAEVFRERVQRALDSADHPRRLVIAAEPITDVDSTAAEMLSQLPDQLDRQGISLAFAEMKGPVKDHLRRYGILQRVGEERFYPTIGSAVSAYVKDYGVDWHDWEDDEP